MEPFKCAYTELIDIDKLVPNPKNTNKHPDEQIRIITKLLKVQGWRHPLIISKRSGFLVAGHGRLEAAKAMGFEKVPVDYQDFENEAQEFAFVVSDNEIARMATFDREMFDTVIDELNIDFNIDDDIEEFGFSEFDFDFINDADNTEGSLANLLSGSNLNTLEDRMEKYEKNQPRTIVVTFGKEEYELFSPIAKKIIEQNSMENYKELFIYLVEQHEKNSST